MPSHTVTMFVMNNCHRDARVLKEARSLIDAGYEVRIIAVLDKLTQPHEVRNGLVIDRVIRNPIHYRILRSFSHMMQMPGRIGKRAIRTWTRCAVRVGRRVLAIGLWILPQGLKGRLSSVRGASSQNDRQPASAEPSISALLSRPIRWIGCGVSKSIRCAQKAAYSVVRRVLLVFHRPLSFLDYYVRAYRMVRATPTDIYHAHDLNTLPVAWWARRRLGGILIYDSHELFTETSTLRWFERKSLAIVEKRLIGGCNAVITVNESIRDELVKRYHIRPPVVIMNCPDMEPPTEDTTRIRDALDLSIDEPIILYQGGFSPNRGLEILISAMPQIPHGVLVFMGWGRIEDSLRLQAEEMGMLNRRIFFLPPVSQSELLSWTGSADVGVIPYQAVGLNNFYSLPNKLFEYIAASLPVAASQFPELARVIDQYNVGLTFDPSDCSSIADALAIMLEDRQLRETMRANARLAAKDLNWGREEEKLLALYKEANRD